MDRAWYFRFSVFVGAIALGWLSLWPSIDRWVPAPDIVKEYFTGRISPGLDIKGGLRLMYEVDTDRYITTQRDRAAHRLLRLLGVELGVLTEDEADAPPADKLAALRERVTVEKLGEQAIRVTFSNEEDADKLTRSFLRRNFPNFNRQADSGAPNRFRLYIPEERVLKMQDKAVKQAVRTVGNRIDNLGLREASVTPQDTDIVVEVPGADPAQFDRIRGIISRTAQLEFRVLDDAQDYVATLSDLPEGITKQAETVSAGTSNPSVTTHYLVARGEDALTRLSSYIADLSLPDDRAILIGALQQGREQAGAAQGETAYRSYFMLATTDVTGRHIEDASVSFDQQQGGRPVVSIRFKSDGAELFRQMTGANVKKRMAIVLDDRVESAPVIQTEIGGGRAQITLGSYQDYNQLMQEANDLVIVLKAGALDAPLSPANEQMIGPTLGADSVRQGAEGALVGVLLVLVFMALYYQVAGVVADLMVVLNLLFLLAIMAAFEATLTLPGIAAIALTVGMAVDANVLITERIREELRLGKSPRSAVDQGFGRAFSSVFDSQLTTFIAGVVLAQYGTGPIKGFAVMLMIGIVTSLFTGVFCSKVVLDWIVRGLRVDRLRVG
ncbi:MAG: protein translocase subunit SecD [Deltaproteobacteria bacterium]|nr:protein translocase subunit SecD [Deltaproteobacteria bacterium]